MIPHLLEPGRGNSRVPGPSLSFSQEAQALSEDGGI